MKKTPTRKNAQQRDNDLAAAARLGSEGGKERAKRLSAAERSQIAKKAAAARWGKRQEQNNG
jgi:hypothetical protein